ncbi:MAG TPA: efflux RND transporter periplasmic adaptor subunit [Alphaproteobacteria bacterium]|nr:efflux RND transporter periplasmic adaptor subunit [Alphaproteobacteria bacterium]
MVIKDQSSVFEKYRLFGGIIFALMALVVFSGWMMRRGVTAVSAEKVVRQDISSTISTNGRIEPLLNFEAHAPAPATVKRTLVREGDPIKAGQLLLQLDDVDARAQAAKALAQLRAAESDLHSVQAGGTQEEVLTTDSDLIKARAERDAAQRNLDAIQLLREKGAASAAEVELAQSQLKKAQATVQLLQSKQTKRFSSPEIIKVQAAADEARANYAAAQDLLRKSNIRAPFAGTVYQLPVKAGSYVNTGDLLVQMANLSKVQVRAFVDEPEIGNLAKGEKVEITWDALPSRTWEGALTQVPTVVTTLGTRTVGEVTCEIQNSDGKLLPRVNVNVNIITARHSAALTVSRESVHAVDGKRFVYQIVDGKLKVQEVQTGVSSLTRVEVLTGLSENMEVTRGAINAQALHSGMEVKVVER